MALRRVGVWVLWREVREWVGAQEVMRAENLGMLDELDLEVLHRTAPALAPARRSGRRWGDSGGWGGRRTRS